MSNVATLEKILPALNSRDQDFARSLIAASKSRRGLSLAQAAWVVKLAERAEKPVAVVQSDDIGEFSAIVALFDKASSGLKNPKFMVMDVMGNEYRLSLAGASSSNPGTINVATSGSFEDRTWFGRISREGRFTASTAISGTPTFNKVVTALKEFACNPVSAAKAYGQKFGNCCFCSKELTDGRSLVAGYGPTCASNYGLPWGE